MESTQYARSEPSRRPRRWVGFVVGAGLVLVGLVLVGFVAMLPGAKESLPQTAEHRINVRVQRIVPELKLADTFQLTAIVEPNAVVEVAAEVSGRIERFADGVEEGRSIEAGAPLVYLNTDLLRARRDRAQAQYNYDDKEYQRVRGLYERNAAPQVELDDAISQRDTSAADLAEAQSELDRAVIRSPIDGVLNRLPMEEGEYAVPGSVVAVIVDTRTVKVVVDVPERDVRYLRVGQQADLLVSEETAGGEEVRPLEPPPVITYISEVADDRSRTTRLELTVDNHDQRLRSGQIVVARLTRRVLEDVIMIPLSSVIPLERGWVVYVVNDEQRAERREVDLGLIKGRSVRVLSGLQADDQLIVAGHRYVGPGQAVTVVEDVTEARRDQPGEAAVPPPANEPATAEPPNVD